MIKSLARHLRRGQTGEAAAAAYLKRQGLRIIASNVRYACGEIDIVAEDGGVLVFVEVRLRQQGGMVSAAQSISPAKQQKWKRAAQRYLQEHYPQPPDCRFDALLLEAAGDEIAAMQWIKGILL